VRCVPARGAAQHASRTSCTCVLEGYRFVSLSHPTDFGCHLYDTSQRRKIADGDARWDWKHWPDRVLVAAADVEVAFGAAACLSLWAALLASRIKAANVRGNHKAVVRRLKEAFSGFRMIANEGHSRLLVGLFGAQTLVKGALNVLIVVAALDLLAMGESGVGWLNAAVGAGGLAGGIGTLSLAGRRRLASPFGVGLVLWGAPILVMGLWPEPSRGARPPYGCGRGKRSR
jgi:hypothetical protein